ncbi:hypothetical protein CCP3SC1AL1_280007 [Gammaproteobacteria bacterium]
MAKLVISSSNSLSSEVLLTQDSTTIGRGADNDVRIDNTLASTHHARIIQKSGQYFLEDLNSTNGTIINSEKIKTRDLKDGDVIFIGKHELRFVETEDGVEGDANFAKTILIRTGNDTTPPALSPPSAKPNEGGLIKIVSIVVGALAIALGTYLFWKMRH